MSKWTAHHRRLCIHYYLQLNASSNTAKCTYPKTHPPSHTGSGSCTPEAHRNV